MEEFLLIDNLLLFFILKLTVYAVEKENSIIPRKIVGRADGYC
jgi:hypothetical protein